MKSIFWSLAAALAVTLVGAAAQKPVHADGKRYEANWESLDTRPIPQWYKDAKFGIFIHWGVYSVPAWGPKGQYAEWYWHALNDKNSATRAFHDRVYGKDFPYENFAPMFRAEMFDPNQWADVFQRSGARYVVLTSKHHEGFCLWPNADASRTWGRPWNSMEVGPHRDLLGDLTTAVRAKGMKMGIYYSLYEWYNPLYKSDFARFRDEHFFPQFKDVVSKYKPAVIFADGEWEHSSLDWKCPELMAWLYNDSGCGDDLVIDDRWGKETRGHHGGYYTTEYGGGTDFKAGLGHKWEENRGIGASYGYNRNETIDEYRTTEGLVRILCEMVSKGGNLLLDVGPTADGRIPVIMQDRLIGIGNWLKVNGDAIYGTEGTPLPTPKWGAISRKGQKLYAVVFDWPKGGGSLHLPVASKIKSARFLADRESVNVTANGEQGTDLQLPRVRPTPFGTVVELEFEGELRAAP